MKKVLTTLAISLALPLVALAAYNDIQLTTGSTIQVTVSGSTLDFTVTAGNAVTLEVAATTLTFTLDAGSSVDIASSNKTTYSISKSSGTITGFTCGDSSSSLTIAANTGTAQTITITPTGTTCTQAGTSGGGGGGGGSSSSSSSSTASTASAVASTPATTPAPVVAVAPAVTPAPVVTQPSVAMTVSPVFNKDLSVGSKSDDVKRLQEILKTDKDIYPDGSVTGYFGNLTKAALVKFQIKHGIIKSSVDSGAGRLGPKTRAKIKAVFQGSAPMESPAAASAPSPSPASVATPSLQSQQQQLESLLKMVQDLQTQLKSKKSY